MFVQGNLIGFGMFVVTGLIVVIGWLVLKLPNPVVMISAGATLIIMDLIFRFLRRSEKGWLMGKGFGGYLYFAPVWIFGIIVIAINLISTFMKSNP